MMDYFEQLQHEADEAKRISEANIALRRQAEAALKLAIPVMRRDLQSFIEGASKLRRREGKDGWEPVIETMDDDVLPLIAPILEAIRAAEKCVHATADDWPEWLNDIIAAQEKEAQK